MFIYGVLFHISSSEFWPITISKTWLNFQQFEYSLLQKPLFTIFLALFHLLPLNDFYHLFFVKIVFSLTGVLSLILFQKYCEKKFQLEQKNILLIFFVILSPFFLNNFFRIRADQFSLFLFSLALYLQTTQKKKWALFTLCLLPLVSVKTLIFLIPGFFLFQENILSCARQASRRFYFYFILALVGVFVWIISLNVSSFYYYLETWKSNSIYSFYLFDYFKAEWPLLLLSLFANAYFLITKKFTNPVYASISSVLLLFLIPQSLPFFIASLTLIIYLPGLIFVDFFTQNRIGYSRYTLFILVFILQFLNLGYRVQKPEVSLYNSNFQQFKYIQSVSPIVQKNNFSYLDGAGILPRARFNPCFISPDDLVANESCKNKILLHDADAVIITQRLSYLGDLVFKSVAEDYTQVKPNFWVKTKYMSQIEKKEIDLYSGPVPLFIFGFD